MVCDMGGQLIGVGAVGSDGTIHLCYVDPDYIKHGVGSRLLNSMMQRAKMLGNNIVNLVSTAAAKSFYETNGFIYSGATMPCYGIPGYPMAQVVDDYFSRPDSYYNNGK
jgi:GNAT superfamily N-acetyltransferase